MRVAFKPWVLGTLSAALLLACGPEPILSVESPSIATVAPGGSTTLTVNLSRNDTAKGPLTFAADGLPEGVSATFSPAEAGEDVEQISLTLTATRDAVRGPALLTLTATGTGKEPLVATTALALEVRGITVKGRIEGGASSTVAIQIRIGETLTSIDGEGRFTIDDVALPYDLTVGVATGGMGIIDSYPGLTTTEPVVRNLFLTGIGGDRSATINLTLGAAVPPDQQAKICAFGLDGEIFAGCALLSSGNSTGSIDVKWRRAPTRLLKVQAYWYTENADGDLTAIVSSAQGPVFTLEAGETSTIPLTAGPAPATTLAATAFALPDWATAGGEVTMAPLGETGYVALGNADTAGAAIPTFAGAPSMVQAMGPDGASIAWRPAGDASPMAFPSLPRVTSSTVGATLSTEFVVTPPAADELTLLILQFNRGIVLVHTMTDRARIPDTSAFWGTDPVAFQRVNGVIRGNKYQGMNDAVGSHSILENFFRLQSGGPVTNLDAAGGISLTGLF